MAGVPKPVLDFLLRPATMMSRQHSGYQAFHKTGKTRSATAIPQRRREGTGMADFVNSGRSGVSYEQTTPLACESPPTAKRRKHQQMHVPTTWFTRTKF